MRQYLLNLIGQMMAFIQPLKQRVSTLFLNEGGSFLDIGSWAIWDSPYLPRFDHFNDDDHFGDSDHNNLTGLPMNGDYDVLGHLDGTSGDFYDDY